jgi:hypothetical protein
MRASGGVFMNATYLAGAFALAVGLTLFFGGIGLVVRDEILGWLGVIGGSAPLGVGYWLLQKPDKPEQFKG